MSARVEDLDFTHSVILHSGSAPWLGALVRTTDALTEAGLRTFGRFDYPGGVQYVYLAAFAPRARDGHIDAPVRVYRVDPHLRAALPRQDARAPRGMSHPSEAVLSNDPALQVPLEMLAVDRWLGTLR